MPQRPADANIRTVDCRLAAVAGGAALAVGAVWAWFFAELVADVMWLRVASAALSGLAAAASLTLLWWAISFRWLRASLVAVGFIVPIVAIVLATSGSTDELDDESTPDVGALDGRSLVAAEVKGWKLVAGTEWKLWFRDGHFSTEAGCNSTDGGYELRGGRLRIGMAIQTMMGCADADQERQDDWIGDVLDGAQVSTNDDTLTVRAGSVTARFVPRLDPKAPGSAVGAWRLIRYSDGTSPPRGIGFKTGPLRSPHLLLSDRVGHLLGGCAGSTLDARHRPGSVDFFTLMRYPSRAARLNGCDGARTRVDRIMLHVLDGRVTVARDGTQLTLRRGHAWLRFERRT